MSFCITYIYMHTCICKDIKRNEVSESIVRSPCLIQNIISLIPKQKKTKETTDHMWSFTNLFLLYNLSGILKQFFFCLCFSMGSSVFLFICHSYHSQDQVEEIKWAEEDNCHKKKDAGHSRGTDGLWGKGKSGNKSQTN